MEEKNDNSSTRPLTVLVEGNIGAGKSTFLHHFSQLNNVFTINEPLEKWREGKNLFKLYYDDPSLWSMVFQSYTQLTMLENLVCLSPHPVKIIERSIFSNQYIFSEYLHKTGKLHDLEFKTLFSWFEFLTSSTKLDLKVDIIFYLRTPPEISFERLKARGRSEESQIDLSFLQELHHLHDEWLIEGKFPLPAPVFIIDNSKSKDEMKLMYSHCENMILEMIDNDKMDIAQ